MIKRQCLTSWWGSTCLKNLCHCIQNPEWSGPNEKAQAPTTASSSRVQRTFWTSSLMWTQSENTMEMIQRFTLNGWTTSKCGCLPLHSLLSSSTLPTSFFLTLRLLPLLEYSQRVWLFGELSTLPCGDDTLMKSTRHGTTMWSRKTLRTYVKSSTETKGLMRLLTSLSFSLRSGNVFHFTLKVS